MECDIQRFEHINEKGERVLYIDNGQLRFVHPRTGRWMCIKRVLRDNLIVKLDQKVDRSKGGIYYPDAAVRRPHSGTVLLRGDGKGENEANVPMNEIQPGDRILFRPISGIPLYWGTDIEIFWFRADSIDAILEGNLEAYTLTQHTEDTTYQEAEDEVSNEPILQDL